MDSFVADVEGPPRRRMYIYRDPPITSDGQTRGWSFVIEDQMADGDANPVWDTWEETFAEIARYPEVYSTENPVWRREADNEAMQLEQLTNIFD